MNGLKLLVTTGLLTFVVGCQTTPPKPVQFDWPTQAKSVSPYSAENKGIDLYGQNGQAIYTAAAGEVLYVGNALKDYGNMVIIKHNDEYRTVYAHNATIIVKEGDKVAANQKIATMGNNQSKKPALHFEIRKNGQPQDPTNYLK